jgi:hypothetical protein
MTTVTTSVDTDHEAVQGIASAAIDTETGHGRARDAEMMTRTTTVGIDPGVANTDDEMNVLSDAESGAPVTSYRGHVRETDGRDGTEAGRLTRASKRGETEVLMSPQHTMSLKEIGKNVDMTTIVQETEVASVVKFILSRHSSLR